MGPHMHGKPLLYLDQYGVARFARTVAELRHQIGGHVSRMYVDKKDGRTVHVGYVVGKLWLTAYQIVERPA